MNKWSTPEWRSEGVAVTGATKMGVITAKIVVITAKLG